MAFLLMVFLTLVCLFERYPAPPWPAAPWQPLALTGMAVGLVALHAWLVSRRVRAALRRDPDSRDELLARYDRWRALHQVGQFAVFGLALGVFGWGWAVRQLWSRGGVPVEGDAFALDVRLLPGIELLTLAPFLVSQVLSWLSFYDADRAVSGAGQVQLEVDPFAPAWLEARQSATAPFGGRWAYVGFQLRQKLALVLIPVLLLIAQKEVLRLLPPGWQRWEGVLQVVGVGVLLSIFVSMPLIIRLVLGLRPLPPGPLRDRLTAATVRLGFRCSDVLVWDTRRGVANAMVVGLVPWLRYVVFTDRLLEEFSEAEVEAVFGHEVGHIRHHHMAYYLGFLMTSMAMLGLLADHLLLPLLARGGGWLVDQFPTLLPASLGGLFGPTGDLAVVPVVALILTYVFVIFGYLSRRCERQADVYGCRAVSCADPHCLGHDEDTRLAPRGTGLCPTGVRTFMHALDKVALLNGISRERPGFLQSWQHSTIARRVAFLRQMLRDPALEPRFQRRLLVLKVALLAGMAMTLGALVSAYGW